MGCCLTNDNEGIEIYSHKNTNDIISDIDSGHMGKILIHFQKGFRFHHKLNTDSKCRSYLAYAIQNGHFDVLKQDCLTVDESSLAEEHNGKSVFSYILSDEALLLFLVNTYKKEQVSHINIDNCKRIVDEFLYYENDNKSELWKNARCLFNIRIFKLAD